MKSFIYYIAERIPGQQEMQRFAHPIHVCVLTADHVAAAYELVCADLTPTFADHPQALEIRREAGVGHGGGLHANDPHALTRGETGDRPREQRRSPLQPWKQANT